MKNSKSQFLNTREETREWLDKNYVKNYTINDDLSIDVNGNVDISIRKLKAIPVNFRRATGDFWCHYNRLTNLAGSPETVCGNFLCDHNNLTNLEGSPETVQGNFFCNNNKLLNLIGSPKTIGRGFYCDNNKITSLSGSPTTVGGDLGCDRNKIINLSGSPKSVGGYLYCSENFLTSLIEINQCNFKGKIFFNIDKKSFKQKNLVKILEKYFNNHNGHYELTSAEFLDIIKPVLERIYLRNKLNKSNIYIKTKNNFI